MSSHESGPSPGVSGTAADRTKREARPAGWIFALAIGVVVGAAAWLIGENTFQRYKASLAVSEARFAFTPLNRELARASARNGALTFGILGGLLGLGMGMSGGLSRRSARTGLAGSVVGLVLGATTGALPSLVLMPYQWNHRNDDPSSTDLMMPLFIHLGLWTGIGLAAGLAYTVGRGQTRFSQVAEAVLRGLVGAALGTTAFELVGAFVFPTARTTDPFSDTSGTRLLARLCVCLFVALAVALPTSSRSAKRQERAVPEVIPT